MNIVSFSDTIGIIRSFGAKSLFVKHFFRTFIPLLILFVITSIVIYSNERSVRLAELERYYDIRLFSVSHVVENILMESENSYMGLRISTPENVEIFLGSGNTASPHFIASVRDIQRTLTRLATPQHLHSIYLSGNNSNFVVSSSFLSPSAVFDEFRDNEWYEYSVGNEIAIFPREIVYTRHSQVSVLTAVHPITFGQVIDGHLIVNFDYRQIVQSIRLASEDSGEVYITDSTGNVILSTTDREDRATFRYLTDSISGGLTVTLWYTPNESIFGVNEALWAAFIIVLLTITAASVALLLTFYYYRSITNIIQTIQAPSISHKSDDNEISFIVSNILAILNKHSALESEHVERLVMLNKAQALSLQSQLNPHFLLNTIHMISSIEMAEHKRETPTTMVLSLLGDILIEAIDTSETFISLEREMDYLQKYMQIINVKYENKIILDIKIDDDTKNLFILKLSLQPLLENSVYHGFSDKSENCMICVTAKKEEENLKITVSDNGRGITKEKLSDIRAKMNKINIEHKANIGLTNTNQRMKLIFGNSYGCSITSDEKGTTVEMLLPTLDNI